MKRRTFLQGLFGAPLVAWLWPRTARAQTGRAYSDDIGTADFASLYDNSLLTGIEYQP